MLEYVIVLAVVLVAAIYVGKRLLRQLQGRGCEDCDCPEKRRQANRLIQIDTDRDKGR